MRALHSVLSLRRCCCALALSLPAALCWGQSVSATQRLEAAKSAMLEQLLRGTTHVESLSWIDTQGRLQQHSNFRQAATFPVTELPPAVDTACAQASTGLSEARHVIALQLNWAAGVDRPTRDKLQFLLESLLTQPRPEHNWRVLMAPASSAQYASLYEQKLLSPVSSTGTWNSVLKVDLQRSSGSNEAKLTLDLRLERARDRGRPLQISTELSLTEIPRPWQRPQWPELVWNHIASQLQSWPLRIQQWLGCERVEPVVTAQNQDRVILNLGARSGLSRGQEWVLVDPGRMPSGMMSEGALDELVLVKISQLDLDESSTVVIAGDGRAVRPGWIALPLAVSPSAVAFAR